MTVMAEPPRIVIDFEHGGFDYSAPSASLSFFTEFRSTFGPFEDVWLFHDATGPLIRGFYYPISAPERYGIPRGRGPLLVQIDEKGDQLWLSGASCGGTGERSEAARSILATLPLSAPAPELAGYDEMHFWKGDLIQARALTDTRPSAPPGKTFAHGSRIACRMEFDQSGTTPADLREIWDLATEPHGWLGRPTSLTLYDSRSRSQATGHEGCQLIAVGETGRELWLQFPDADSFERLGFVARTSYHGSFTEYEAIKAAIFRSVGVDVTATARSWRDVLLAHHPLQPEVIGWP